MSAARPRSREVKLIFFIASTIGRASKLVMSICSTVVESSSALRVSLMGSVIDLSLSPLPPPGGGGGVGRPARANAPLVDSASPPLDPLPQAGGEEEGSNL